MVTPVSTSECYLQIQSSLEVGSLGGMTTTSSSRGQPELKCSVHDKLGRCHYYPQTMPDQSDGPYLLNQLVNGNQVISAKSVDYHDNLQSSFLLSKNKSSGTLDGDASSWKEVPDESQCEKGNQISYCWQRIKWTNDMIKFLIDTVNNVGEDTVYDNLDMNKRSILQKKGKWRLVSNVMNQKGWCVSPQQCEDKFNDLNKRYKRLTDILGREIALQVVDNAHLLDNMNNLSAKRLDDVKKILSSKHSFYKEMHSYHSGVKFPVAYDLQTHCGRSLGKACVANPRSMLLQNVEFPHTDARSHLESSLLENTDASNAVDAAAMEMGPSLPERSSNCSEGKQGVSCCNANKESCEEADASCAAQDEAYSKQEPTAWRWQLMHLEELKVGLQAQVLELAIQRQRWQKLNSKKNDELESLRAENKRMKSENDQLARQLKQKELEVECKRSVISLALFDLVLEKLRAEELRQSGQGQ